MARLKKCLSLMPYLTTCLEIVIGDMIPINPPSQENKGRVEFGREFEILGPFRIGTREVVWGADPLERIGGFHSLSYNEVAVFDSPLGRNGSVQWGKMEAESVTNSAHEAKAILSIAFQSLSLDFTSAVYGWAALQYQAWARCWLTNHAPSTQKVELFTDGIWEYSVNNERAIGGDLYGLRKAPLVVTLKPGINKIDLRIYRDVRAFGGLQDSPIIIKLEARRVRNTLFVEDSILISDKVNGKLPSPYASVVLRNLHEQQLQILSIRPFQGLKTARLLESQEPPAVYPGQSRPINLALELLHSEVSEIALLLTCKFTRNAEHVRSGSETLTVRSELKERTIHEPHKVTFLHRSRAVSYAILRPPTCLQSTGQQVKSLPVMLNLHGAGVDVNSAQLRQSLDEVPDLRAWFLFPQGGSLWSGDDFHTWGFADVGAAIDAIPSWVQTMEWKGPGVDIHHWMVIGHSNGGQGSWLALSHYPDKIVAGAPISAYTSIQNYVPYILCHEMEPLLSALLHCSMNAFKHELLVENLQGIPLLLQHGSNDDNVPVYHSRLMKSLIHEIPAPLTYAEVPGAGHWFEGVMTTSSLQAFYRATLNTKGLRNELPIDFTFVVVDSDDFGSRGGLVIDQMVSPARLARIRVHRNISQATWHLQLTNVHRFHLDVSAVSAPRPRQIILDNAKEPINLNDSERLMFARDDSGFWKIVHNDDWKSIHQRYGRQRGALDAILRTTDRFCLLYFSDLEAFFALQISRNLFQYFGADSELVCRNRVAIASESGNTIFVGLGYDGIRDRQDNHSVIHIGEESVCLKGSRAPQDRCYPFEAGLGAIFLNPLEDERLELVVWGYDEEGLSTAARLVPTLTGAGQPDFIIITAQCRFRGAAGVAAAGFFGHDWQISTDSFFS